MNIIIVVVIVVHFLSADKYRQIDGKNKIVKDINIKLSFFRSSVRLIQSHRYGVGKTLKVQRTRDQLKDRFKKIGKTNLPDPLVTITLHAKSVDHSEVFHELLGHTLLESEYFPRIFHIDIAHEVTMIIYFESILFFHAQLGLDVSPDMKSLHISLNTGHSCHQLHF